MALCQEHFETIDGGTLGGWIGMLIRVEGNARFRMAHFRGDGLERGFFGKQGRGGVPQSVDRAFQFCLGKNRFKVFDADEAWAKRLTAWAGDDEFAAVSLTRSKLPAPLDGVDRYAR
jgi:hypothetical protein